MKPTMTSDTITTQLYINGKARAASDGGTYPLHNPARPSELVGHVAAGTESDVDDAVRPAHSAFPAWSALSYAERAAPLSRVADLLVGD